MVKSREYRVFWFGLLSYALYVVEHGVNRDFRDGEDGEEIHRTSARLEKNMRMSSSAS